MSAATISKRPRPRFHRRGIALVWVAILIVPLIAIVGLAVDWGYVYWNNQKLQDAADAAALAGAQQLLAGQEAARAAAITLAAANEVGGDAVLLAENAENDASGDIVIGVFSRSEQTFTPTAQSPNAVKIVARRREDSLNGPLPVFFGHLLGIPSVQMASMAIAISEGGTGYPSIIALNDSDPQSFYVYGNATLDVLDNTVQVNSSSSQAAVVQGTKVKFSAGEVNIVGKYQERGRPQMPQMNEEQPYMSDPLAGLPEPEPGEPMYPPQISGIGTFDPGYYPQGLNMNAGDNVFLNPGVYILDEGFKINGHARLEGHGVMIFIRTGQLHENGTGHIYLTPPTEGIYEGVTFFQARDNTNPAIFNGRGLITGTGPDDTVGTGTMYFPSATLNVTGNGTMYASKLIADKIVIYGDGETYVTDGHGGPDGIGRVVYLVK